MRLETTILATMTPHFRISQRNMSYFTGVTVIARKKQPFFNCPQAQSPFTYVQKNNIPAISSPGNSHCAHIGVVFHPNRNIQLFRQNLGSGTLSNQEYWLQKVKLLL